MSRFAIRKQSSSLFDFSLRAPRRDDASLIDAPLFPIPHHGAHLEPIMNTLAPEQLTVEPCHSDQDLVEKVLSGDRKCFDLLVERYQSRLWHAMRAAGCCSASAEDVVQETFVKAYVYLKSYRKQSSFYTWLYRIAINSKHSYYRKMRPEVSLDAAMEAGQQEATDDSSRLPDRQAERVEENQRVVAALGRLDQKTRDILMLREYEECDYRSISNRLGITMGTVRSRLSRARGKLRDELENPGRRPIQRIREG